MVRILIRWFLAATSMFIAVKVSNAYGFKGIWFDNFAASLVCIIALTLINAIIRPAVKVLSCAINMMTLGLFSIVINGAMWFLVGQLSLGLHVRGILDAIVASVVISILGWILDLLLPSSSGSQD